MHFLIRKCPRCGAYTLKDTCPKCGFKTVCAHPPRFSPIDKYVKYRVVIKELNRLKGLEKKQSTR